AHETVMHICIVNVPSRDRSIRIDSPRKGSLVGACTPVRTIELSEFPIPIQQKPVIHTVSVNEDSEDASVRSKAPAKRALLLIGAPAWKIECGDEAVRIP